MLSHKNCISFVHDLNSLIQENQFALFVGIDFQIVRFALVTYDSFNLVWLWTCGSFNPTWLQAIYADLT